MSHSFIKPSFINRAVWVHFSLYPRPVEMGNGIFDVGTEELLDQEILLGEKRHFGINIWMEFEGEATLILTEKVFDRFFFFFFILINSLQIYKCLIWEASWHKTYKNEVRMGFVMGFNKILIIFFSFGWLIVRSWLEISN